MKLIKIFAVLIAITAITIQAQDPMIYQRWNIMDINRVRTYFNNTGLLGYGNEQNIPLSRSPSFEYPSGSGINYGTCVGLIIGAPGIQEPGAVGGTNINNLEYLDASLDEGPAAFWDEEHFAPYPEVTGNQKANLSTDKSTWPINGWPKIIPGTNESLLIGSDGWPGMGKNGQRLADQETYSVMYGWKGTDLGDQERRWLKTNVEMRGMAWSGELYQDFIVWVYVIRNIGTAPIKGMRVGAHIDFSFLPLSFSPTSTGDADRHYYDPQMQFAYGTDDDGYEVNHNGETMAPGTIAYAGAVALRMPGHSKKIETYDAFHFWMEAVSPRGNGAGKELYYRYNLLNSGDQHDSNKDGIDDDFNMNGVPDADEGGPGYYLAEGADGIQLIGSGAFDLAPGQTDTLIFATVFGMNKNQLYKNATNAQILYASNWKVVTAPEAPKIEIVPGNGSNTIYWSIDSENDPEFEGYKVYRSPDRGITWGTETFKDFSGTTKYVPLAQYDLQNGIKGNYKTLPEFAWYYLGNDSGLPPIKTIDTDSLQYFKRGDKVRMFTDNDITNGFRYRYYVAAYDSGNGITGPLENTANPNPGFGTNTLEVVPHAPKATSTLSKIKVVPNPYVVSNGWEQGRDSQIQFTGLPEKATIKIFNVSGELIKTVHHEGRSALAPSIAIWDAKNEDNQLVAAGLYFYFIETPIGTAQGKFVVIL
ncbi:MAG: hypothetical protein RBS48_12085 [Ignavibacteriaceae bacterium]|jgi:hypothetical protein|nr:hypothetical protein [Ignavibacteriaceae bacterium]